ncbi:Transcription factor TFIIIB component B [Tulasnella sp. 427]|nr:Transcription factor TFIIIB component B [Tulasnella sp. 427]
MYTSSRVEKGGSQYKPIVKPRPSRTTQSTSVDHPSQTPRTDESSNSTPRLSPETRFVVPPPPSNLVAQDQTPGPSSSGAGAGAGASAFSSKETSGELVNGATFLGARGVYGTSPSAPPTIRSSVGATGIGPQSGPSASPATVITPSRSTTIVPTRGTAIIPTRGQSGHQTTGGTAIIQSRGATIVPTRGGAIEQTSGDSGSRVQSAVAPAKVTPIVPTRATSIVPTRGITTTAGPTNGSTIAPSRGTSIIPTRGTAPTQSSIVASASAINNNPFPVSSPQVAHQVPLSTGSIPVAGPSRTSQQPATSAVSAAPVVNVASRTKEQVASSSTVQAPDKPQKRPRPRTKANSKGKAKATEPDPEAGADDDVRHESRARPRRTVAKRKRDDEVTGNDDEDAQSSASKEGDGEYQAPVEQETKAKRKREKKAPARKRKPKSTATVSEAGDDAEEEDVAERTRAPARRFRKRQKKLTPFDLVPEDQIPVDEEGLPMMVDPDAITMAELCVDLGVGRPSSRTEESIEKSLEWKERQKVLRQQARQRQKAKYSIVAALADGGAADGTTEAGATTGGQPIEGGEGDHDLGAAARRLQDVETNAEASGLAPPPSEDARNERDDNHHDLSGLQTNRHAVQVRLDENGEIVMDELSLTVDRYEEARAEAMREDYELVEEAERDRFVNSLTWSKKLSGSRWTKEETELFYYYHGMWGTDFEMIAHLMPGRTRREIRNKYNTESKKNPTRMDQAFARKIPIDLDELSKATGLDFSGPVPEYGPPVASLASGSGADADLQLRTPAAPDDDDDADLPDLPNFNRRTTSDVDESGRAGSPISATSGVSSAGGKKGKGAKAKQGKASKKGKKKGQILADDEEVIGTVEGF